MAKKGCFAAVVFSMLAMPQASAHPHVFIDSKAAFHFDDEGRLSGLRITWVYDPFTSLKLIALLDLDQDNDGVLSESDISLIVKAQTVWPEDFNGDVYLEKFGQPVALGRPINGDADWVTDRISVSFELPLDEPLTSTYGTELRLYDPTYYFAYSATEVEPAENCQIEVKQFKPDQATSNLRKQLAQLSREETPEQDDVGRLFADVIGLQCA
ncbi:MAG: DUF1007 family protein [Pseudomonadota bacterium]